MREIALRYGFSARNVYHTALGIALGVTWFNHWALLAALALIFLVGYIANERENRHE
jgi:hypothetical protein